MRYVVYLITLLLFSFSVQSNQSLEQSRANLSRINSDESDSGIACASAVLAWRVLCCKFNYTLMERSDKQKSFRFFTPNTLIWQEQELYLLKTQKTPVSLNGGIKIM
ncbi:hypothetical protein EBU24_02415 [bacterium]|nr:hypothetical protein [bacterium]